MKRERAHGTRTKFVHDGCRCLPCRAANANYAAANARARQQGRVDLVDAGAAREHIRALRAVGVGSRRIAERAGIARSALRDIEQGVSTRIRTATEAAILQVPSEPAAGCGTDGTGTRRRLRALVACGWSQQRLAADISWTPSNFTRLITDDSALVAPRTATAVRALYDRLWDVAPPCATSGEVGGRNRASRRAAQLGWLPPLYWDDDDIDDPSAGPSAPAPDRPGAGVDLTEVEFLLGQGVSLREVAARLGVKAESIERAQQRRDARTDAA